MRSKTLLRAAALVLALFTLASCSGGGEGNNGTAGTTLPLTTEEETGDGDVTGGRPVYLTVMIIALALLLTGAAVFTVIYLIERHKNKMRNE